MGVVVITMQYGRTTSKLFATVLQSSVVTKMFTLVHRQQFPKVGKLLVNNKSLETVVHNYNN